MLECLSCCLHSVQSALQDCNPINFFFLAECRKRHRSLLSGAASATLLFLRCSLFPHLIADMDGPGLFPAHRCKTIHLVRHAQGVHNVEGDKNYKAYMSAQYFDAELTPLGWEQVDNLRTHVHASGLLDRIELVITSPLMRTLQTAVGVFGGGSYTDRVDGLPLMVANAGNSGRAAISSSNSPPIIAAELCREHFIETDEDTVWKPDVRETTEELAARGLKFLNWLWTRSEKEMAIVTHSGFLFHTLNAFGNDCHPLVKKEICTRFSNCELRSMVIVDRSMIGSDPSTTDYPGKIPNGPDLPSE
ncbi:Phosphoglycerate mutase-like protein 1 [Linum perenne]